MEMEVSSRFKLEDAVCNHGFFMMAPNTWYTATKTLARPLRLLDNRTVTVSISQPRPTVIAIYITKGQQHISPTNHHHILNQVKRMLRLSNEEEEAMTAFHTMHSDAANEGFGRLFRNPSLFEDIVKTILLCGCRFKDSLDRAEKLCNLNPKRKKGIRKGSELNFPTAQEVSSFGVKKLERALGYRCHAVLDLAMGVVSGEIDLDRWENSITNGDELYKELINRKGIGDFVASNILMCLGFYHRVPVDSETKRHIKHVHQCVNKVTNEMVKDIYDKYAPFQALAYWFELLKYYESKVGKLSLLEKAYYKNVTGSFIERRSCQSNNI